MNCAVECSQVDANEMGGSDKQPMISLRTPAPRPTPGPMPDPEPGPGSDPDIFPPVSPPASTPEPDIFPGPMQPEPMPI